MCHSLHLHCFPMIRLSLSMCSFKSVLCRWLFVCLCFCFLHVSLSLSLSSISGPSCQCPAIVCLRAAHLCSHHSYSSQQRCLCHSVPHQSDCSQLRQPPSVLLPLYWPKLTAGGQVRATAGPEYSEYNTSLGSYTCNHPNVWQQSPALPQPVAHPLSPSLSLQLGVPASLLYPLHPHLLLRACASVSCHSQVRLIAGIRPFHQLEKHIAPHTEWGEAVIFNKLWGQGGLSHKWTWWFLTLFSLLLWFMLQLTVCCCQTHLYMMLQQCHLMVFDGYNVHSV